jgi:hypothetical protein
MIHVYFMNLTVTAVNIVHQSGRGNDADQKEGDESNEQKKGSRAVGLGQSNHLQAENGRWPRRVSKKQDYRLSGAATKQRDSLFLRSKC